MKAVAQTPWKRTLFVIRLLKVCVRQQRLEPVLPLAVISFRSIHAAIDFLEQAHDAREGLSFLSCLQKYKTPSATAVMSADVDQGQANEETE
jgi:hypothetical protein